MCSIVMQILCKFFTIKLLQALLSKLPQSWDILKGTKHNQIMDSNLIMKTKSSTIFVLFCHFVVYFFYPGGLKVWGASFNLSFAQSINCKLPLASQRCKQLISCPFRLTFGLIPDKSVEKNRFQQQGI